MKKLQESGIVKRLAVLMVIISILTAVYGGTGCMFAEIKLLGSSTMEAVSGVPYEQSWDFQRNVVHKIAQLSEYLKLKELFESGPGRFEDSIIYVKDARGAETSYSIEEIIRDYTFSVGRLDPENDVADLLSQIERNGGHNLLEGVFRYDITDIPDGMKNYEFDVVPVEELLNSRDILIFETMEAAEEYYNNIYEPYQNYRSTYFGEAGTVDRQTGRQEDNQTGIQEESQAGMQNDSLDGNQVYYANPGVKMNVLNVLESIRYNDYDMSYSLESDIMDILYIVLEDGSGQTISDSIIRQARYEILPILEEVRILFENSYGYEEDIAIQLARILLKATP